MKKILLLLIIPFLSFSQQTYVPNDLFEMQLIWLGYDNVLDDYVSTNTINSIEYLSLNSSGSDTFGPLDDLTGLEDFTSLINLQVQNIDVENIDYSNCLSLEWISITNCNNLLSLNISQNTSLTYAYITNNPLLTGTLDVSNLSSLNELQCWSNNLDNINLGNNNYSLTTLACENNPLNSLDLTGLNGLIDLFASNINITSLDLSQNLLLETCMVYSNPLTNLDLSANTNLTELYCGYGSQIESLDLSNNTLLSHVFCNDAGLSNIEINGASSLIHLDCQNNNLTSIDISNNNNLTYFFCNNNQLTSLDISANNALQTLDCQSNQLTDLDLRNGNNIGMFYSNPAGPCISINNPQLFCIDVDNAYLNASPTQIFFDPMVIDPWSFFSPDCDGSCVVDTDGDGVCDELVIAGCNDASACNYNSEATEDDGSCEYPALYYDCYGNCLNDVDSDNICDELDDCIGQFDECGECNGNGTAPYYDCDGNCINDLDNDEVCDELDDCVGEYDECGVCNGNGPQLYYDCNGNCISDIDIDEVCDELDNCPEDYNPNQEDFNADDIGDACDGIGLDEATIQKKLVKVVDILGREIDEENKDALLLYIYDDGSVEKKYVIE